MSELNVSDSRRMPKSAGVDAPSSTREILVQAGVRLFAVKGFEGTTVKELAEEAGVNISLISYHFGGKDGLYRACFEQVGLERLRRVRRLFTPAASLEEIRIKLSLFCESVMETHCAQPHVHAMIHRECEAIAPRIEDIFKRTYKKIWDEMEGFFSRAQKDGILDPAIEPQMIVSHFMHGVMTRAKMDWVHERLNGKTLKDPDYRSHVIQQIIQLTLHGISEKRNPA